ncbi:DUF3089 domain-containing protein [Microbacterium sp. A82]|uniref:DUF3089 domain-containing protein n=1 Tax=Microbacterium sp. A82 TaxID=3450452 RepID=UPI003F34EEE3
MTTDHSTGELRAQFDGLAGPDYAADSAWIRRRHPSGRLGDPAVFYVHPTTERTLERWFADPHDAEVRSGAAAVAELHGHAFPGNTWAPAYRQATTRAFHQHRTGGDAAYDLAFGDVRAAFHVFLHELPDGPFVIAGHSQGARHTIDLLAEIAEDERLSGRLVAAYAIGAGIRPGREGVLDVFPLPRRADQCGVLIGWNASLRSETAPALERRQDPLSVNPITFVDWQVTASPAPHLGGATEPFDRIRVSVASDRGHVLVDEDTDHGLADFALPGGSLHAVEVQLFSRDLCADVRRRTSAWRRANHR